MKADTNLRLPLLLPTSDLDIVDDDDDEVGSLFGVGCHNRVDAEVCAGVCADHEELQLLLAAGQTGDTVLCWSHELIRVSWINIADTSNHRLTASFVNHTFTSQDTPALSRVPAMLLSLFQTIVHNLPPSQLTFNVNHVLCIDDRKKKEPLNRICGFIHVHRYLVVLWLIKLYRLSSDVDLNDCMILENTFPQQFSTHFIVERH